MSRMLIYCVCTYIHIAARTSSMDACTHNLGFLSFHYSMHAQIVYRVYQSCMSIMTSGLVGMNEKCLLSPDS